jgi:parallel beta-helix repeat protein
VRVLNLSAIALCGGLILFAGCSGEPGKVIVDPPEPGPVHTNITRIEAGPEAPKRAQTALIEAKEGDVIELGEGRFDFTATLSLDSSGVTIRGQGPDKTILSFKDQGQGTGGEGLLITSKQDVTLEQFAVEDARGDAIKANGTKKIAFRAIRVEWTGGPKETNGGYGIYPVLCSSVVIEDCKVSGASDAGIYVGQSQDIVVRYNTVQQNVAGIEIENSTRADVYGNTATDNSGGILVFTMPDLPTKEGKICRVYHNKVIANNHDNFAPKGNIVATVPPGTGVMIMANKEVEVFDNTIDKNQTAGLSIVSYLLTDKPMNDPKYDPFCDSIFIHNNQFTDNGGKPSGALGEMLAKAMGSPLPDILYDGIIDPKKQVDGKLPEALALRIKDNGKAGFANFDAMGLKAVAEGKAKQPNIVRDLKAHEGSRPALSPVSIEGLK